MSNKLNPCPECGSDDLTIESSNAARLSEVLCNDCDYVFQRSCCEEDIAKHWNKLNRDADAMKDDGGSRAGTCGY
jgi:transcription initiation factor TFIIIB Brf1 subunit/transcription initiation factor TFIIB